MSKTDETVALVKEVQAQASSLGLTWNLRLATIIQGGSSLVELALDGDDPETPPVAAISLIGAVVAGARVMTLWTPPNTLYIIGAVGAETLPRVEATTSSAGVAAETVVLTTPIYTFKAGLAYRVRWRGQTSATGANTTTYRVRRTGLTGTLLGVFTKVFTAIISDSLGDTMYVVATSDVTDVLVLTLQASAATTGMTASTQNVRYLEVEVAGPADNFPNAITL